MKKFLIGLLALCSTFCSAQYFQHLYGFDPAIGTIPKNGMNTSATGPGHLVGGIHITGLMSGGGDYGVSVIRTDANGQFISPNNFANSYMLVNAAGDQIRFTSGQVIEYSDGSGYAAIGTYFYEPLPRSFGIAYIELDTLGNVMNTQGYSIPNQAAAIDVMGLKESSSKPGEIFATGLLYARDNNFTWCINVDRGGGLLWGNLYDFNQGEEIPNDLIESPYNPELIIVGRYNEANPALQKGFWMTLDPATGGFMQADVIASWVGNLDYLHSIDTANDPMMPGFILAGVSDERSWVSKTDQNGNFQWSGIYQPANRAVNYMYGYDATGRLKDDGTYEYFVTGPVDNDAYIFKIDNFGFPVGINDLFVYDLGPTVEETGLDVDVNTNGSGDGVTMYAVAETDPLREVYTVKAYFNGVSGCNESFEELGFTFAEFLPVKPLQASLTAIGTESLMMGNIIPLIDTELCQSTTVPGGSNAKMATISNSAQISPNPALASTDNLQLQLEAASAQSAELLLYDMTGKLCYQTQMELEAGANSKTIALVKENLPKGMYSIKIRGNNLDESLMLLIH
jgi:hypothetical protein